MTDYQYTTEAVDQYYSGEDQWKVISNHNITPEESESALGQLQNVNIVKSANGKVVSYNFQAKENVTPDIEESINSNVSPNIKSFEIPSSSGVETVTSETGETVKQMTFKSGLSKAGNFVFGQVVPAIGAVATGITLGKTIDSVLYNINPDFWDEHGMDSLNPDTWGDIVSNDSLGGKVFNMILGITPSGETQAYMDENALAYMAMYLKSVGVFSEGESVGKEQTVNNINIPEGIERLESITKLFRDNFPDTFLGDPFAIDGNYYLKPKTATSTTIRYTLIKSTNSVHLIISAIGESSHAESWGYMRVKVSDPTCNGGGSSTRQRHITIDNKTITYIDLELSNYESYIFNIKVPVIDNYTDNFGSAVAWYLWYGNWSTEPAIDGITNQDNAKTPDLSDDSSVEDVLDALKKQYPELWENAVDQDVAQPDGSTKTYTYVPVAMPEIDPEGNPVSSSSTQKNPQIDPAEDPEPLLDLISKIIQRDPPVNPPDIGSGITPIVPSSSGSASALYMIYNPTLAQINSFGAWLWSDNFVDQIKKLFNDPMQAIIGLHKVYATPATGGAQTIKVGYLDSGVSAKVVSNQYTTIDCGTVRLSEQFHNVFDYSPYTEINLYLPFIGIVNINVSDVMRSSIHIVYHVDVLSGACLAEVKVTRDSAGGTLYQYAGNASVTLPISSGSYMGIVSAVAGVAGGIAGTIASGGSALPLLASSAGAMFNAHTRVEHSGGFSGNAGAMGGKIPYLIISRPQTEMADGFENYIGYPSNFTATIGSCTGFIKVIECHVKSTTATNSELNEINTMLQEGVIV